MTSGLATRIRDFNARERDAEARAWEQTCQRSLRDLIADGRAALVRSRGQAAVSLISRDEPSRLKEDDRVWAVPAAVLGDGAALLGPVWLDRYRLAAVSADIIGFPSTDGMAVSPALTPGEWLLLPREPLAELANAIDRHASAWTRWWPGRGALVARPAEHPPALAELMRRNPDEGARPQLVSQEEALSRLGRWEDLRPVASIHGPPGSGKTRLLAELAARWLADGRSVLAAAFTNRAVDELVLDLAALLHSGDSRGVQRLGRQAVREDCASVGVSSSLTPAPRVCLATTLFKVNTLAPAEVDDRSNPLTFDVGIVDEASQVWLGPLLSVAGSCRRLLIVGDTRQLPPLIHQPAGPDDDLFRSALELVAIRQDPDESLMLRESRRMNRAVCSLASRAFYEGRLQSHRDVSGAAWPWNVADSVAAGDVRRYLRPEPGVEWVEVPAEERRERGPRAEATLVAELLVACYDLWNAKGGAATPAVGHAAERPFLISCFHRRQVAAVRRALLDSGLPPFLWHVDTVERNQGRSCSISVLSLGVESLTDSEVGFFHARGRWNVALTRARYKVFVVGTSRSLLPPFLVEHLTAG